MRLDAVALGNLDLPREVIVHHRNRISAEIKVADFADVLTLHVTNDHCRVVSGDRAEQFITTIGAGEVEDAGAGFEASAGDGGLMGFDGDEHVRGTQGFDDRQQLGILFRVIYASSVSQVDSAPRSTMSAPCAAST